jgi:hypothetical protein
MGKMRQFFVAVASLMLVFSVTFEVKCAEPGAKPQRYEYTGIIKAKSQAAHLLTVQTQSGPMDFHYQRHGKRECAGFKELSVGDSIKVTSAERKAVSEAACITKIRPPAAPK